jgi:hypothetical protein
MTEHSLTPARAVGRVGRVMRLSSGRLLVALAVAALVALGSSAPALAHVEAPVPALAPSPALDAELTALFPIAAAEPALPPLAERVPGGLGWPAVLAGLAALALLRRAPRRAVVLAVVLLLAVFAFENGVHSVHHGADRHHMTSCALSAASSHLSATLVDHLVCAEAMLYTLGSAPISEQPAPIARPLGAHQGRAPPSITP